MSVPGDASDEEDLLVALILYSLFLIPVFALTAWPFALVTTAIFGAIWWHRHGYRSEAVIHEKIEVRRKMRGGEDEDDEPPQSTFLVHLRYSVPTTKKEETSSGGDREEFTMVDNPNWVVLPYRMRGIAVSELVPILVDPSNTEKIRFADGLNEVCGALVCLFLTAVLPGTHLFFFFSMLAHIDENEASMETRVSAITFFAFAHVGIFVWVYKRARYYYNQNMHYEQVADISEYERILVPTEGSSEGDELMEHVPTNNMEEANKP